MSVSPDNAGLANLLPWTVAVLRMAAALGANRLAASSASRRPWYWVSAGLALAALQPLLVAVGGGVSGVAGRDVEFDRIVEFVAAAMLSSVLARAALAEAWPVAAPAPPSEEDLEAAERLEALLRGAPDAIVLCDADGTIVDANDSAAAASGIARENLIGRPGIDFLAARPPDGPIGDQASMGAADAGKARESILDLRRPDGRRVWLDVRSDRIDVENEHFLLVSARDVSDRRRVEEQALSQEGRLNFILEQLPAYIWTTDRSLRMTAARGRGLEALGVKAGDIVGRRIDEIFPAGELRDRLVQMHRRALAGELVTFREKFRGRVLDTVISCVVEEGVPFEVVGVTLDSTDRERAESTARASDLRLHEILEHAPVMAMIKDLDLRIIYANREWERVTGLLRTVVVGKTAAGLLPPLVAQTIEAHDREALDGSCAVNHIEELGRGAKRRSFDVVKFPLLDADGHPYALCALMREVSERVAMTDALRRRALFLDEAQTMAHLGNWEWDLVTGRRFWSPHLFTLLGLDPELGAEAAYEAYMASVPEEDRQSFMEQTVAGVVGATYSRIEHRSRFADGSMHWVRTLSRIDRNEDGVAIRVCGFAQDITADREAAEQIEGINERLEERVARRTAQIEDAIRELSTFSYAVSHDLRQPLRAIAGYLSLLEEDVGTSLAPSIRAYLDQVQAAARRMDATIDALLSLTRLTRAALHRDDIDASAMVHEIVTELGVADPSRKVEWVVKEGVRVLADRGLFRLVLQNLLGNAFKFTRGMASARVEFGSEQAGDATVLFVRDDGAGFLAASARRLFEPFQRMHDASQFEGTGIGLATVARIVRRHGGWIRADSSPGLGATFRFHLPSVAEDL